MIIQRHSWKEHQEKPKSKLGVCFDSAIEIANMTIQLGLKMDITIGIANMTVQLGLQIQVG